jgi:hypothetical protein
MTVGGSVSGAGTCSGMDFRNIISSRGGVLHWVFGQFFFAVDFGQQDTVLGNFDDFAWLI